MSDPSLMRRAIELARESVHAGGGPFGAVVVDGGRPVGVGRNSVVPGRDPTAHAEIEAIRAACRERGSHDLSGCEIYASCEPCPMCLGAILWARLSRLHYACTREDAAGAGFDDARFHTEIERPGGTGSLVVATLLRDEGLAAFRDWAAKEDRRGY